MRECNAQKMLNVMRRKCPNAQKMRENARMRERKMLRKRLSTSAADAGLVGLKLNDLPEMTVDDEQGNCILQCLISSVFYQTCALNWEI